MAGHPCRSESEIYFIDSDLTDRFSPEFVQGLEKIAESCNRNACV
jgi:hypothetical protein